MSDTTEISWCDSTFNPIIGCTKVGPGCDNCYAEHATPSRTLGIIWGAKAARYRTAPANWAKVKAWHNGHAKFLAEHGRRRRVFCASLSDVFDNAWEERDRLDLWALVEDCTNLDFLLTTKRIGNVCGMVPLSWLEPGGWPGHVRIIITVVNQEEADRDIPKLLDLRCPNGLSMEPLLGPVDLGLQCENWSDDIVMDPETGAYECCKACDYTGIGNDIHWVIVGGESGTGARPMHPDWVRSLRDQCAEAGVPFHFKQWGEWCTRDDMLDQTGDSIYTEDLSRVRVASVCIAPDGRTSADIDHLGPHGVALYRLGKKAAGRMLDNTEHNEFPVS